MNDVLEFWRKPLPIHAVVDNPSWILPYAEKLIKRLNENVRSIRPGYGLAPQHLSEVLVRPAARHLKRGEPLDWEMVDK